MEENAIIAHNTPKAAFLLQTSLPVFILDWMNHTTIQLAWRNNAEECDIIAVIERLYTYIESIAIPDSTPTESRFFEANFDTKMVVFALTLDMIHSVSTTYTTAIQEQKEEITHRILNAFTEWQKTAK